MPKERIDNTKENAVAEALVCWGNNQISEPLVELFVYPKNEQGLIAFHPDHPENFGLKPGETWIAPVRIHFNREQVNRLIRVMRTARDKTFGRDE